VDSAIHEIRTKAGNSAFGLSLYVVLGVILGEGMSSSSCFRQPSPVFCTGGCGGRVRVARQRRKTRANVGTAFRGQSKQNQNTRTERESKTVELGIR